MIYLQFEKNQPSHLSYTQDHPSSSVIRPNGIWQDVLLAIGVRRVDANSAVPPPLISYLRKNPRLE